MLKKMFGIFGKKKEEEPAAPPPPPPEISTPEPAQSQPPPSAPASGGENPEDIISKLAQINSIIGDEETAAESEEAIFNEPEDAPPPEPAAPEPPPAKVDDGNSVYLDAAQIIPLFPEGCLTGPADQLVASHGSAQVAFHRAELSEGLATGQIRLAAQDLAHKLPSEIFTDAVGQLEEAIEVPLMLLIPLVPPAWYSLGRQQDDSKEKIVEDMEDLFDELKEPEPEEAAAPVGFAEAETEGTPNVPAEAREPEPMAPPPPPPPPPAEINDLVPPAPMPEPAAAPPAEPEPAQETPAAGLVPPAPVGLQPPTPPAPEPPAAPEPEPEPAQEAPAAGLVPPAPVGLQPPAPPAPEPPAAPEPEPEPAQETPAAGLVPPAPVGLQPPAPPAPEPAAAPPAEPEPAQEAPAAGLVPPAPVGLQPPAPPAPEPPAEPEPEPEPAQEAPAAGLVPPAPVGLQPPAPPAPEPPPAAPEPEPEPAQETPAAGLVPPAPVGLQPPAPPAPEPPAEPEPEPEPAQEAPAAGLVPPAEEPAPSLAPAAPESPAIDELIPASAEVTQEDVVEEPPATSSTEDAETIDDLQELANDLFGESTAIADADVAKTGKTQGTADPSWRSRAPNGIDINRASVDDLCLLNGVGSHLAASIIEHRDANGPFDSLQGLKEVAGLGSHTYKQMTRLGRNSDLKGAEIAINQLLNIEEDTVSLVNVARQTVAQTNLHAMFVSSIDGLILARESRDSRAAALAESLSAAAPQLYKRSAKALKQARLPDTDMVSFYLGKSTVTFAGSDQLFVAYIHSSDVPSQRELKLCRRIATELVWYCSYRAVVS